MSCTIVVDDTFCSGDRDSTAVEYCFNVRMIYILENSFSYYLWGKASVQQGIDLLLSVIDQVSNGRGDGRRFYLCGGNVDRFYSGFVDGAGSSAGLHDS